MTKSNVQKALKMSQRQIARVIAIKEFLFDLNNFYLTDCDNVKNEKVYFMSDVSLSFSTLESFQITIDYHTRVKSYLEYYNKVQKAIDIISLNKDDIQKYANELYRDSVIKDKNEINYTLIKDVEYNMHYFSVEIVCSSGKFKRVFSYMDFLTHDLEIIDNEKIDNYESVQIVD